MTRDTDQQMANMVKANFGIQFVRLMSGNIGLGEFVKFAIFRPIKFVCGIFMALVLVTLLPIEAFCWYSEHTSFLYHLVKGDLESISGQNSRSRRKELLQKTPVAVAIPIRKAPETEQQAAPISKSNVDTPAGIKFVQTSALGPEAEKESANVCTDDTASIAVDSSSCKAQALGRADQELNRLYNEIMERLSAIDAASLKRDERAWIKTKEAVCNGDVQCQLSRTQDRVAYLRTTFSN